MSRQRKVLESQLSPQQKKAAQLIVSNDWGTLIDGGKKKTMQELADEIGIARSTLFEWKALDSFGEYVNYLTDQELAGMRTEVYTQLMRAIRGGPNGIPSVKALELFMRRFGMLTDRTVVEDTREAVDSRRKTDDEIRKDIADLDALVSGVMVESD